MNSHGAEFSQLRRSVRVRRALVALSILIATFAAMLVMRLEPIAATASQDSSVPELTKMRDEWVQDLRTRQLEPILKFYASNAAFLQPDGRRITGAADLRTLFQNIMAAFNSDLTLQSRSLEVSGDLAYDSGDFTETLKNTASGATMHSTGSYVVIYKRQPDGHWKIVQHVWTGIPPAGT